MPTQGNVSEFLEKAELDQGQKDAVMAALDALELARDGMDTQHFDAATSALATLLIGEPVEDAEGEPEENAGTEGKADMGDDVGDEDKSNMDDDVGDEEDVMKSEFEAVLKSKEAELAELRKSIADRDAELAKLAFVRKAEELSNLPVATEELAALLQATDGTDAGETLGRVLASLNEIAKSSNGFQELGGGGEVLAGRDGAMARIEAMASELVTKSANGLTRERAMARVLDENPALYSEWINQG